MTVRSEFQLILTYAHKAYVISYVRSYVPVVWSVQMFNIVGLNGVGCRMPLVAPTRLD